MGGRYTEKDQNALLIVIPTQTLLGALLKTVATCVKLQYRTIIVKRIVHQNVPF